MTKRPLSADLIAFYDALPRLLRDHLGEWALISGGKVHDAFFSAYGSAIELGYQLHGLYAPFIVMRVDESHMAGRQEWLGLQAGAAEYSSWNCHQVVGRPRVVGIEASVCGDIAARQALGVKKYGQTLSDNHEGLRARLQHAYEEMLDGAIYLKWAMEKISEPMVVDASKLPLDWDIDMASPSKIWIWRPAVEAGAQGSAATEHHRV